MIWSSFCIFVRIRLTFFLYNLLSFLIVLLSNAHFVIVLLSKVKIKLPQLLVIVKAAHELYKWAFLQKSLLEQWRTVFSCVEMCNFSHLCDETKWITLLASQSRVLEYPYWRNYFYVNFMLLLLLFFLFLEIYEQCDFYCVIHQI